MRMMTSAVWLTSWSTSPSMVPTTSRATTLQDYLQSIGVEYGRNLNAYTSIEKTVYYFTDVPTTRAISRRFLHAHPQGLEQRYLSDQGGHQ